MALEVDGRSGTHLRRLTAWAHGGLDHRRSLAGRQRRSPRMNFFDTAPFPARWACGQWPASLGWLTIASDVAIFLSYTALPLTIAWYVRSRRDVPFPLLFWLFSAFIFACGATHLLEVVIFWYPLYPVQALLKAFTAVVSIATVVAVGAIMPKALAIPGMAAMNLRLQDEIAARSASQAQLQQRSEDLQRSEARLLAAQREARIGDWQFDPKGERIFWSEEVYRLFGRTPAAGPPRDLAENLALYTPRGAEALGALLQRVRAGEDRVEGALEVRLPAGGTAWQRSIIHAERGADGIPTRIWGTAQDITEQKLDDLAKDQQRLELLRINEQLEQFAYIASHDLQEPVRKMRFFSDVVMHEGQGRLSPEGDDALKRLGQASERMSSLIRDLLSFARAGKSLGMVSTVAMGEVLRQASGSCATRLRESGAQLSITALPAVTGDQRLLVQVFQHLLTNALMYCPPGQPPVIEVSGGLADGRARIVVRDHGLGFPADQAGRLFDPFVRLHPQVASTGSGISLAVCRRIVEAHGGRINAAPVQDGGAEFIVSLPMAKEVEHAH
jgi:two-component system sensor kinase FixL